MVMMPHSYEDWRNRSCMASLCKRLVGEVGEGYPHRIGLLRSH